MSEEKYEIEKKFLLKKDIEEENLLKTSTKIIQIYQTYINIKENEEDRIRKSIIETYIRKENGEEKEITEEEFDKGYDENTYIKENTIYTYTKKIGHGEVREEYEEEISEDLYKLLLENNKIGRTIYKTRHVLKNNDNKFKEIIIDIYPTMAEKIAEVEFRSKEFIEEIPEILKDKIERQIINEKKYSNKAMAICI